jgi:hypothetical protein
LIDLVFLQPHIFVVFQQGAGGNFLCALLRNLLSKDVSPFVITNRGSAHPQIDLKVLGKDYLAFGTLPDDQLQFNSIKERETFYLDNIKKEYSDKTSPQVVWTHDYSNIPLYQKHFPNSKILVITQDSIKEKVSLTVMNVLKTLLGPGSKGPFPPEQWDNIKKRWQYLIRKKLQEFVKIDIDNEDFELIKEKYYDIYKYAAIITRLTYFQLEQFITDVNSSKHDVVNNSLFNLKTDYWFANLNLPLYTVGENHKSFINDKCVQLPFDYVLSGNIDLLIESLEKILGKLNQSELSYTKSCFDTYISKQEKLLLYDPILYIKNLEQAAYKSKELFLQDKNEN